MPIVPTYPGVYIEEVSSGVRPITGVATSILALVGFFSRGPMQRAHRILSAADFEREYGGLRTDSLASYAVQQFFLNGGQQAWIVRTAASHPVDGPAARAAIDLRDPAGNAVYRVLAANEGGWGNHLRLDVDYGTTDPATSFNLRVSERVDGRVVNEETFRNLSVTPGDRRFVVDVVNDGSKLIQVEAIAAGAGRPAPTGTVSAPITSVGALTLNRTFDVSIDGTTANGVSLAAPLPTTIGALAASLQTAIRGADPAFARVTVTTTGTLSTGAFLHVRAGTDDPDIVAALSGDFATDLGLAGAAQQNVQQYSLGGNTVGQQQNGVAGEDGAPPDATELIAALPAFDPVDLINILILPDTDRLGDTAAAQVAASATAYAASRRAFYIVDPPQLDAVRDEVPEIEAWLDANGTLRHANVAAYFPRPLVADSLADFRLRAVPASGTVAGLYARTDAERGVWKAPAGLEATLRGVQRLEYLMTDAENGVLNPLGAQLPADVPQRGQRLLGRAHARGQRPARV